MQKNIQPYNSGKGKKEEVREMFDNVSAKYDFLNRLLSVRIDILWRNKVVNLVAAENPSHILDVATGTGDLAIALGKKIPSASIIGFDLSEGMLKYGREKVEKQKLSERISMIQGDAESMPFDDNTFDVVTASFGVRNFENLEKGLSEFKRVLKPGGKVIILEFSQPQAFPMKQLYHFYSFKILPTIGKLFSKDSRAYAYLPESIMAFPYGEEMIAILSKLGYREAKQTKLSFGISTIYECLK